LISGRFAVYLIPGKVQAMISRAGKVRFRRIVRQTWKTIVYGTAKMEISISYQLSVKLEESHDQY
jgi:hypothetical protein